LVMTALWVMLQALQRHSYPWYRLAGLLAGLGMAARFPSVLAILPVLLVFVLCHFQEFSDRRLVRLNVAMFALLAGLYALGGWVAWRVSPESQAGVADLHV
jgi:4-amino-4-deoxy-L-arabinose transferase-like glycosyltransferase